MMNLQNVGVVAASAGAVIAYVAYRRFAAGPSENPDLRSEACKERESLRVVMKILAAEFDLAKQQRRLVSGEAMGQGSSEFDGDFSEVQLLQSELNATDIDFDTLSFVELELRLIEILALSMRAHALAEKYSLSVDDSTAVGDTAAAERAGLPREPHPAISLIAPADLLTN